MLNVVILTPPGRGFLTHGWLSQGLRLEFLPGETWFLRGREVKPTSYCPLGCLDCRQRVWPSGGDAEIYGEEAANRSHAFEREAELQALQKTGTAGEGGAETPPTCTPAAGSCLLPVPKWLSGH